MKGTLERILKLILPKDSNFEIEVIENELGDTYAIKAEEKDRPRLIGRGGKTIKSIHNLVNIVAKKENKRVFVRLED